MKRAAFLDRDGVINKKAVEGEYVTSWEAFHILPGVAEGIRLLNRAGFSVIVVTNQRCVSKGQISVAELETMHRRMAEVLAGAGATIDDVRYCPHAIEAACPCRKPAPGMLLEAARLHGVGLGESWMIGDSDIDIEAGKNAGCRTAKLCGTRAGVLGPEDSRGKSDSADVVASSFLEIVRQILEDRKAAASRPPLRSRPLVLKRSNS